jgi:predicted MPP superfamily phosphohydrolase
MLMTDIIVIVGDLVDGSLASIGDRLRPLKHLKAKYGVYYVSGTTEIV